MWEVTPVKLEKCGVFLMGFFLACLLSMGAMGALCSGLDLPLADPDLLRQVWTAAALAGCVLFLFRRGWIAALVLVFVSLVWLWPEEQFFQGFQALLTRLSVLYDSAYGWGTLEFAGVEWREIALDMPLAVWGCLTALSAAATVMQNRWTALTLALAILPVAATVVVTNTAPAVPFLYLWLLGLILLLLTATVRRQSPGQGARLTALAALPLAAALALLFYCCPQDTYVNQSKEQLDSVVSWWQEKFRTSADRSGLISQAPVGPNSSATANLSRVGPRNTWAYTVMEAEADFSGTLYIRGQDFDRYDGTAWTSEKDRKEGFGDNMNTGTWTYTGSLTLRSATAANVRYLPYYPSMEYELKGGQVENTESLREYSYGVLRSPDSDTVTADTRYFRLSDEELQRYTQLPAETADWARAYLQEHFSENFLYSGDAWPVVEAAAEAIADHVRGSARYDTNTRRMPGGADDFARWFLEESDTGYCVHFASAATVLLRARGIPARYVTGYMFTAEKDRTVEVTADQAHAWVEYYHQGKGVWVVLEATPADLTEDETDPPATQAPDRTEPTTLPPEEKDTPTRPQGGQPGENNSGKADLTWLWTVLKWLLVLPGLWLAVLAQYGLRKALRPRPRDPNGTALALWVEADRICRFTKQPQPEDLLDLAQKAKYSQHTLTEAELTVFRRWLQARREALRQAPWYRRLVYRYILCLW